MSRAPRQRRDAREPDRGNLFALLCGLALALLLVGLSVLRVLLKR